MVAGDLYGDLAGERADSSHRRALGPHQSMCGELTDDDVMLRYDGELVGVTVLHASTSRRVLRKTRFGLEGSLPPRYSAAVAADRVCDEHEAAEPDAPSRCRSWCRSRREMKRRSAKLIEVQNLAKTSVLVDHPDKSDKRQLPGMLILQSANAQPCPSSPPLSLGKIPQILQQAHCLVVVRLLPRGYVSLTISAGTRYTHPMASKPKRILALPSSVLATAETLARNERRSVEAVLSTALRAYAKTMGGRRNGTRNRARPAAKDLWETIAGPFERLPSSVLRKLPRDAARNHDRYIYGRP